MCKIMVNKNEIISSNKEKLLKTFLDRKLNFEMVTKLKACFNFIA